MGRESGGDRVVGGARLAELLAALSLASDLGLGAPLERGLRICLAGMRIGELAGVKNDDLRSCTRPCC